MFVKRYKLKSAVIAVAVLAALVALAIPNKAYAGTLTKGPDTPSAYSAVAKDGGVGTGSELYCDFKSSAEVHCKRDADGVTPGFTNEKSYWYDPLLSKQAGHDVFRPDGSVSAAQYGYLHFPNSTEGRYKVAQISTNAKDGSNGIEEDDVGRQEFKTPAPAGVCSLELASDGKAHDCTVGGKGNEGRSRDTEVKSGFSSYQADEGSGGDCEEGGALGFILCPIQKLLNDGVTKISSIIISMLNVPTSEFQDPQLKEIFSTVLIIANSLFALVFLIAIFANTLAIDKIDNYTIKKALPRLVIAVLLSQFAYYISIAVIEIGNVLGAAIPQTLFSSLDASLNFNPSSVVNSLAGILFSIIFLLIALVAFLIGIFVLALRQIILIGIVLTGPIAFAAWVLPGTEKGFKFWWTNLVKLTLMYPIMSTLIVGSLKLSEIIQATNSANFAVKLGALALPIVAMLYLPKTFKWSGQLMAGTAGKISDYGTKKTKGLAKDSAKEGKIAEGINKGADKFMDTPFGKGITRTPMLGTAVQKNLGARAKRIESKQNLENLPGSRLEKMASQGHKGAAEVVKKKYSEELDKQESRAAKGLSVDATKLVAMRTAIGGVEKPGSVENTARATSEANRLANAATNYVNSAPTGVTRQMPQITYSKKADGDGVVRDYFAGTRHTKPGVAPPAVAPGAPTLTQPGPAVVLTAPAPGGGVAAVPPPHGGHP